MRGSRVSVAILFSFFVAQSASATPQWAYDKIVQRIQIASSGSFIMYMPPGTGSTCAESGTIFSVATGFNGQTVDGVKASLAVVMMAFAMGKPISFAYDDTNCTVASVIVSR
jgi:hypothetical protein